MDPWFLDGTTDVEEGETFGWFWPACRVGVES